MDLCKTDKRVDYARKYVLTNFSNLEKTELKELREKFLAAYKHNARDVKAYRNKLSQLHTAQRIRKSGGCLPTDGADPLLEWEACGSYADDD